MAIKIFLDTNILLDVLDSKRTFHKSSTQLIGLIEEEKIIAFLSESVLTTTDYILQKIMKKEQRLNLFAELSKLLIILPCTQQNFIAALQSKFDDLEDVLLYQIAFSKKLDYFVSNDKNLKTKLSTLLLPIKSPDEVVKIFLLKEL